MYTSKVVSWIVGLALALVACGGEAASGTSVRIALTYDRATGLDAVEVVAAGQRITASISPELLLLLPDDAADGEMPIEVWARAEGQRAAYGTTSVTPVRDTTVEASLSLMACAPACDGDMLTTCTEATVTCALGCSSDGDAHCIAPQVANGVDPTLTDNLLGTVAIASDATFNVDTGEISGGLVRPAGEGTIRNIAYAQMPAPLGGVELGVFAFHNLTIAATATVRFTGTRAVVFLVGDEAIVDGKIDLAAGRDGITSAGPGGGVGGATPSAKAGGCGPGGAGERATAAAAVADGGGGGGGGATSGGEGGLTYNTSDDVGYGGDAGPACMPPALEPLRGGSGGGAGSFVNEATSAPGGGGGGALQLTAFNHLVVAGTINAGGAGGGGGAASASGAGAGGGGGAGGGILLEAASLELAKGAKIAANGGGGGGGGGGGAAPEVGLPGENGTLSLLDASGGPGAVSDVHGGHGGGYVSPPEPGGDMFYYVDDVNAGGGGGAAGAIVLRGRVLSLAATPSPQAARFDIQPR